MREVHSALRELFFVKNRQDHPHLQGAIDLLLLFLKEQDKGPKKDWYDPDSPLSFYQQQRILTNYDDYINVIKEVRQEHKISLTEAMRICQEYRDSHMYSTGVYSEQWYMREEFETPQGELGQIAP